MLFRSGRSGMIFESAGIDPTMADSVVNLSKALTKGAREGCYFIRGYNYKQRLPLGFTMPVVYVNTTLVDADVESVSLAGLEQYRAGRDDFFAGVGMMYFSDTGDFFEVQQALPGMYRLIGIEGERIEATLSQYMSAANCSSDEAKVALRFIEFLYSDNAQDHLYLRNRNKSLPLNKYVLGEFAVLFVEFEGFFDDIDTYRVREGL